MKNKGYYVLLLITIAELVYSANNPDRYSIAVPIFMGFIAVFIVSAIAVSRRESK